MKSLQVATFLVVCLGLIGCSDGPPMAEVEGTVKVGGKPVDKIQVEFWPAGKGPRSIGVTDAAGRYTLQADDGKRSGAAVGTHKVLLKDVGIMGDKFLGRAGESVDMTKGKAPRINAKYSDATRSDLNKEVTSGKNVIDFDIAP